MRTFPLIDFHSHVLPGIDDGSRDTAQSIQMLQYAADSGIHVMAATPHYYPHLQSPDSFMRNRSISVGELQKAMTEHQATYPTLLYGAEVAYFEGISRSESLKELAISGTELLLIEMPFCDWSQRMLNEVCRISDRWNLVPMLAHIERYLTGGHQYTSLEYLRSEGVLMQANAEFFLGIHKRKALRMLCRGEIAVLGSDCHNMNTRKPCLDEAYHIIEKELGADMLQTMARFGINLLHTEETVLS